MKTIGLIGGMVGNQLAEYIDYLMKNLKRIRRAHSQNVFD